MAEAGGGDWGTSEPDSRRRGLKDLAGQESWQRLSCLAAACDCTSVCFFPFFYLFFLYIFK